MTIQKQILDLIAALQKKRHMSVLFITHDLAVVGDIADYVVVMQNGAIQEQGAAKAIFETPRNAYTKALLDLPAAPRPPAGAPAGHRRLHGRRTRGSRDMSERVRGVEPGDPIVLEVSNLGKKFFRGGTLRQAHVRGA